MKVGIIGCGSMGGAMARIISKHHTVILHDHKKSNAELLASEIGAAIQMDLTSLAEETDALILAIKPKDIGVISETIGPLLKKEQFLISILAGASLATLQKHFPSTQVFRVMPNLPLLCGQGMLGIAEEPSITPETKAKVEGILKGLGAISWLQEKLMNAFTALTSSNPAFIYLIIEAMTDAGVSLGFKSARSLEYVLQTIEGSVALLRHTGLSPDELKRRICSPGGATIAGLEKLESEGVRSGIVKGLKRCYERVEEMGGS